MLRYFYLQGPNSDQFITRQQTILDPINSRNEIGYRIGTQKRIKDPIAK